MDSYRITIGDKGSMKDYKSLISREINYSSMGNMFGIQLSSECTEAYEKELVKRIEKVFEAFNSIAELKRDYGFLNGEVTERKIESLDDRCLKEINECMEISKFESINEIKETFNHIFSNVPSHIKDYIVASQLLESKCINIRNL